MQAPVVQPSSSLWASSVVMVRNLRQLLAGLMISWISWELPIISAHDLACGYWQIHMHPNFIKKTAFVTL